MSGAGSEHRLFVYGTLAPGEVNAHVLEPLQGDWQPATLKGSLHAEGWGATYGFPAMRLDPKGEQVPGLLFTSSELSQHWARLDEFEGLAYRRVIADAITEGGFVVKTNVYVLNE